MIRSADVNKQMSTKFEPQVSRPQVFKASSLHTECPFSPRVSLLGSSVVDVDSELSRAYSWTPGILIGCNGGIFGLWLQLGWHGAGILHIHIFPLYRH